MLNIKTVRNTRIMSMLVQRQKRKHHRLDQAIASESKSKLPDLLKLQRLKRLRLRIKDEIFRLDGVMRTIGKPIRPDAA